MKKINPHDHDPDLISLVSRLLDDGLDEAERAVLEQRLLSDPDARQTYILIAQIEAELHWLGSGGVRQADSTAVPDATIPAFPLRRGLLWGTFAGILTAAACLILAVLISRSDPKRGEIVDDQVNAVALLVDTSEALWGPTGNPTRVDSILQAGSMRLNAGRAVIRFTSGALLTMLGPASIDLLSDRSASLIKGTVTVDIPSPIPGFHIGTPAGDVYDRGTVFGISVNNKGATEIHVIEGEVEVVQKDQSAIKPYLIRVGKAQVFGRGDVPEWQDIECTPEVYRTLFPGSLAPIDPKWKLVHEETFQTPPDLDQVWEIHNFPIGESRPTVTWQEGHIKFVDRGYLIFRKPLEMASRTGLRVAGRWKIVSPNDQPEIVLHTDAVPQAPYGDVKQGVSVGMVIDEGVGVVTILPRSKELSLEEGINIARIPAQIGDSFNFELTEIDQKISFRVWNANENSTTATLYSRITGVYQHHLLAFYNRNRQRWPMVLHLDHVRIDEIPSIVPASP